MADPYEFGVPIDMAKLEIRNAAIHNLASAPSSPAEGQVYDNTADGHAYAWLGGEWKRLDNLSGADILVLLMAADGSGSGLDADLLDGNDTAYFLARGNHTGTQPASSISDFDTQVRTNRLDQMAAPSAAVGMGSQNFTSLASATASGQAVEYAQWMNALNGTRWKQPVRVMSTGNLTLSGTQTIDGVAVVVGDRVGAFGQTVGSQDGIWLVAASAWSRVADFASGSGVANAAFFVQEGTIYGDTQWNVTNNPGADVVGTNDMAVAQIGAGTGYSADESTLHLAGTTFSIKSTYIGQTSITTLGTVTAGTWNATVIGLAYGGLGVDASSTAGKKTARDNINAAGIYSALIGDGSTTDISIPQATHGLAASNKLQGKVYVVSTGKEMTADITVDPSTGNVTVGFAVAPAVNSRRIVLQG